MDWRAKAGAQTRLRFLRRNKVVFATDIPLGPIKPAIEAINALDISAEDRRKIFAGNAERLLRKASN